MNKTFLLLSIGLFSSASLAAAAETMTVFKAAATIPVAMVIPAHFVSGNGFVDDVLIARTLVGKDLINLALGRQLTAAVDVKTEVLCLGVVTEGPGQVATGSTRVIVYDPSPSVTMDANRIKATIFTIQNLDFDAALIAGKITGQGIGQVTVNATPNPPAAQAGDSTKNALLTTILNGAGTASATVSSADHSLTGFSFMLKSLAGALHCKFLDAKNNQVDIDGVVTQGVFTTTGKPLKVLALP